MFSIRVKKPDVDYSNANFFRRLSRNWTRYCDVCYNAMSYVRLLRMSLRDDFPPTKLSAKA